MDRVIQQNIEADDNDELSSEAVAEAERVVAWEQERIRDVMQYDSIVAERNFLQREFTSANQRIAEMEAELQNLRKANEESHLARAEYETNVEVLTMENDARIRQLHDEWQGSLAKCDELLSNEKANSACIVCFETPRNTLIMPCLHFQFCQTCVRMLPSPRCPTCRGNIAGTLTCNL